MQAFDERLKHRGRTEQARVEKIEQRPQIAQAVLDRRAGQGNARLGGEFSCRFALTRGGILDGLGFIKNHQPPDLFRQPGLPGQHGIGCDDQVSIGQMGRWRCRNLRQRALVGFGWMQEDQPQRRRKPRRFASPVPQQRRRYDQQRRRPLLCGGFMAEAQQQRQDLDRLAQAHVVSQAGAEAQLRHKTQPGHALPLIRSQRALQSRAGIYPVQGSRLA